MRLNLSTVELEAGKRTSRFGKVQLDNLRTATSQRSAIRVSAPSSVGGKRIGLVVPKGLKPSENNSHEFTFLPIWTRAFAVCHMRSTKLKMLVIETEKEKVTVTEAGVEPCSYTTSGAGVGAVAEEAAELLLGKLIDSEPSSPVVRQAVAWLAKKVPTKG